jgi:drug/metabolite transporter (DMT)-like permease
MKGVAYILAAVLLFSILDALVKAAAASYSIGQIVFFRSAFAFVPLSIAVWWTGGPARIRSGRPMYHAARGILGLVAMGCFFTALRTQPLADVVAISFTGPLFIALLARPLLGERLTPRRWAAVLGGFIGVLLIIRPGTSMFTVPSLLPLVGALAYSTIMMLVRRMGSREGTVATAVFFTTFTMLASAATLPWTYSRPDAAGLFLLVAVGLAGGCANLCLTQAFKMSPVGLLAPFEYTALIWGILFGYAFWGEVPDWQMLVGAMIVVTSGLMVVRRPATIARPRG